MKFSMNLEITNRASQVLKWIHEFNGNLPIQLGFNNHFHDVQVTSLIWKSWDDSKIPKMIGKSEWEVLNHVRILKQHPVIQNCKLTVEVSEASANFPRVYESVCEFHSHVTNPKILAGVVKFCQRGQIMEKFPKLWINPILANRARRRLIVDFEF